MSFKPMFDAVIFKKLEKDETSYGNIIVPDMGKDLNEVGEVIEVGPGYYTVTGNFIETTLKEGDMIILPATGYSKFVYKDEEYYIINEKEVLAKIQDNE